MSDPVNHPSHYTSDPSGVECIQVTRHRNFNIGNAIKYLWRAGLKDSENSTKHGEDLRKAIFYIQDEIARLEGTSRESASPSPFTCEEISLMLNALEAYADSRVSAITYSEAHTIMDKLEKLQPKDEWLSSLRQERTND